jgi:hypothetical protein
MVIYALLLGVASSAAGDSLTLTALRQVAEQVFRVQLVTAQTQVGLRTGYSKEVDTLPTAHPLASFVRENRRLLTFLVQHTPAFRIDTLLDRETTPEARQTRFAAALWRDSAFQTAFRPLVARYLMSRGGALVGYAPPTARPTITERDYLRVAVRFFDPFVNADGGLSTHVCTALNALEELGPPRNRVLEALAFEAILSDITRGGDSRLERDFRPARRLMNRLDLGEAPEMRVRRAQGVLWGALTAGSELRTILREAYAARAAYLPFVLVNETQGTSASARHSVLDLARQSRSP